MIETGGTWDASEAPVYFIASAPSYARSRGVNPFYDHILFAVNEIKNAEDEEFIAESVRQGKRIFIDSGVFNLTMEHARAHDMRMDVVLGLAPDQVDGFDSLYAKYVRLIREFGEHVWGYIEIDQGGMVNKRITRKRLHDEGLRPIPVYHPLNDGWDYFDELASSHDRMCFGNVVQADRMTRRRLMATAWHRRKAYPHLWIHLLGLTPNELCNALPVQSVDSSTWVGGVRWMSFHSRAMLAPFAQVDEKIIRYDLSDEEKHYSKSVKLAATSWRTDLANWRGYLAESREVLKLEPFTGERIE